LLRKGIDVPTPVFGASRLRCPPPSAMSNEMFSAGGVENVRRIVSTAINGAVSASCEESGRQRGGLFRTLVKREVACVEALCDGAPRCPERSKSVARNCEKHLTTNQELPKDCRSCDCRSCDSREGAWRRSAMPRFRPARVSRCSTGRWMRFRQRADPAFPHRNDVCGQNSSLRSR
jgi:hypothetical protein